jgi:hypothetical protein
MVLLGARSVANSPPMLNCGVNLVGESLRIDRELEGENA